MSIANSRDVIGDLPTTELLQELKYRSSDYDGAAILLVANNLLEQEALMLFKEKFQKSNIIKLINSLENV